MSIRIPLAIVVAGAILLIAGSYYGLAISPPEEHMGNVQRIMYVHVPTAWCAMLVLTYAFGCATTFLFTNRWLWDHRLEAAIEMADWDPRLTTVAVLLSAFVGIAALRHFVDDPMKRATWSAVATVIGYIDVPIVYFSVKWWNSLHQKQSNFSTVSRDFLIPLFTNFAGLLLVISAVLIVRAGTAALRLQEEIAPPPMIGETAEEFA